MKCDDVAAAIPDYLTDGLDPTARKSVQAHMAECPSCRAEVGGLSETWARLRVLEDARPSPSLRAGFYAMLEAYPRDAEEMPRAPERRGWSPWAGAWAGQAAAAVLVLLAGVGLGRWSQARPGGHAVVDKAPGGEGLAVGPLAPLALIHRPTAGERLRGVTLAGRLDRPDEALVNALLDAVDNDPNVNVRVSAVESLFLFAQDPRIRERLTESLARQTSPVVQIALIDLLVASREKQAAEALARLIKDRQVRPEVRDHAESGLKRLL